MDYKKLFGWGIGIYAAVFLVISVFVGYKIDTNSLAVRAISVIVVAVMAFFGGRNLKASSVKEIIKYSIGWAVIVAIFDLILTVPFTGWEIYAKPDMYIGYALIVLIPLLAVKKSEQIQ